MDRATWFAEPKLACQAVARYVGDHLDDFGPVTFVNPPSV